MKTYREALKDGMEAIEIKKDGEQEPTKVLPICLSEFICSIGAILTWQATTQLDSEVPTAAEIMAVFSGVNNLQHAILHAHTNRFLSWLLDQQIEDDDNEWDGVESLAGKWNEFARRS